MAKKPRDDAPDTPAPEATAAPPPDDAPDTPAVAASEPPSPHRAIRAAWTEFARAVPYAAQSSGVHVPSDEAVAAAPDLGVPDGRYRVMGADWILTFADGKFVGAERAGAAAQPGAYVEIPG